MTETAGLRAEVADDGVATLTIARPEKRNAFTAAMWSAFPGVLAPLAADPRVRVLLVTGEGGTFSAGADIAELSETYSDPARADAFHGTVVAAEEALAAFPRPTLAVVRGSCVGGGCQLAVACDLRFAEPGARFGITPAKLGVVYSSVPTARLTRLVGPARAKYLLYSAELVSAARAEAWGLVDEVADDVDARAREFARILASRSPQTLGAAKAVVDAAATGGDAQAAVEPWERRSRVGPDVREGLAAFLEGRQPHFTP
ncbi:enoyl-CoA hydratase [Longispora fulva]|uniref:Enoyl-CoA hydratase/carnithine racemase n=1 Tax=Longispora fulva TaxID=619741 RepID=A0A8J7KJC5_9ACTN|nr:enoyl-CoA hydratase/isomerase family protein [Longispora fulva]MBG6135321.1 enoyl-CoA hydratase/carnithine racemase [Longispora fulva]GIG56441.1 enoyl-CoA hydratase [Longispora fulva]